MCIGDYIALVNTYVTDIGESRDTKETRSQTLQPISIDCILNFSFHGVKSLGEKNANLSGTISDLPLLSYQFPLR